MIDEGRRQKNLALISSPSHQAHWCEALVADGLPLLPEAAAKPPRRRRKTTNRFKNVNIGRNRGNHIREGFCNCSHGVPLIGRNRSD
jgi:hypothetical protein